MDRFHSAHASRFAHHSGGMRTQMQGSQINVIQKGYIMFQLSATYQRSAEGRHEIVKKCCGLTQTERLALILVDGINPASEVRDRIHALNNESFRKVMDKLLSLGLICEVIEAPADLAHGQVREARLASVRVRDRLAPVTIVRNDPQYDFSVGTVAAATDFPSLCPTASAALVLAEWTRLRGWHVRDADPKVAAAATARRRTYSAGKASASLVPWWLITKRCTSSVDRIPISVMTEQHAPGPDTGKRPVAMRLLLCFVALLTGTIAVIR